MLNFIYHNPVKIIFGKGAMNKLNTLIPGGVKIMLIYGGGSIKKNGIYDKVKSALNNQQVIEFGGIEPNPEYQTLLKAVDIVLKNNIQFLLAVGGGSVIDGTKFIAAASEYQGKEKWDIITRDLNIEKALPLGCVLTLPAAGSEMNGTAVISRRERKQKLAFQSPAIYPKFSILDPEVTYSLSNRQVANGIIDIFVHVIEQYLTYDVNAPLQDRQAEAILLTLIDEAPIILSNKNDYNSRANFMWCATQALNGIIGCGVPGDWTTHLIGHELTAYYGIDHGQSLALVLPSVLHHCQKQKAKKIVQYAERVWKIKGSDKEKIQLAIQKTIDLFQTVGMKMSYSDYNIQKEKSMFTEIAEKIMSQEKRSIGENKNIWKEDIIEILMNVPE
jgi:NADP-dependent alcohol dehydrogenase